MKCRKRTEIHDVRRDLMRARLAAHLDLIEWFISEAQQGRIPLDLQGLRNRTRRLLRQAREFQP